jgi:hypothetical protein
VFADDRVMPMEREIRIVTVHARAAAGTFRRSLCEKCGLDIQKSQRPPRLRRPLPIPLPFPAAPPLPPALFPGTPDRGAHVALQAPPPLLEPSMICFISASDKASGVYSPPCEARFRWKAVLRVGWFKRRARAILAKRPG